MSRYKLPTFKTAPTDPLEWAKRLEAKHRMGAPLLECQINAYRTALRIKEPRPQLSEADKEALEERLAIQNEPRL